MMSGKKRFEAALTRADEMIYKEANILFPNCAFNFTDEEWFGIYRDSKRLCRVSWCRKRSLGGRREGTGRKDAVHQSRMRLSWQAVT